MQRFSRLALCVALIVALTGCATQKPPASATASSSSHHGAASGDQGSQQRAKKKGKVGAFFGALAGAVLGYAVTGKPEGALVGAAAGGLIGGGIGFAVGKHQDKVLANRDSLINELGGTPTSNYLVAEGSLTVSPGVVEPGQKAILSCTYICLPPGESVKPDITYCEFLRMPDGKMQELRKGSCPVVAEAPPMGGGRILTEVPLTISPQIEPGDYLAILEITWGQQTISSQSMFTVQAAGS